MTMMELTRYLITRNIPTAALTTSSSQQLVQGTERSQLIVLLTADPMLLQNVRLCNFIRD